MLAAGQNLYHNAMIAFFGNAGQDARATRGWAKFVCPRTDSTANMIVTPSSEQTADLW